MFSFVHKGPWWEVDLGADVRVAKVKIWNTVAENLRISLIDSNGATLHDEIISTVLPVIEISPTFTRPQVSQFLAGYVSSGTYAYANETAAKDACKARTDCNGVTQEPKNYTLRAGSTLTGSSTGEVSWLITRPESVLDLVGNGLEKIRKVRVQLEETYHLDIGELQVFDHNGFNVALNKKATQSSTLPVTGGGLGLASYAVNGNLADFSHTNSEAGK